MDRAELIKGLYAVLGSAVEVRATAMICNQMCADDPMMAAMPACVK
jgi:hypothetical protein